MPKQYLVKIKVPSGSRAPKLFDWLNKLLEPHRMSVTVLQSEDGSEGISAPGVSLIPILSTPTLHSELNKDRTAKEDET